jgi:peptidyl-prolyl cis-trans isomerase D
LQLLLLRTAPPFAAPSNNQGDPKEINEMLYTMRHKVKAYILWLIIAAFVGTIFVGWGIGSGRFSQDGKSWVARVGEATISVEEYRRELLQMETQYRDFPTELLKNLNLKQQALDNLINRRIFTAQARKMGVDVPDAELAAAIREIPSFQQNGGFSTEVYRQVLALSQLTPGAFEEQQRSFLRIQKLQQLVQDSAKVSDREVRDAFMRRNAKVAVDYAVITADEHPLREAPTEEALQAHYDAAKENFRTPEQMDAVFSQLRAEDFFSEIEIADAAVQQYYDDNHSLYFQPEKVRARHILVRIPDDADEAAEKTARERIEKIYDDVQQGKPFDILAQEYSEDSSTAPRGGDLGFFERGQMVPAFDTAAFSLQPGEASEIIRTRFGFHVIKLEERQAEQRKSLEEVREAILAELKYDQAMRLARKKAMALYADIRRGNDFREVVEEAGFPVSDSGYFSRADAYIPEVPTDLTAQFKEAAFAVGGAGPASPVREERGYFLLAVKDLRPARIPPLDEIRNTVQEAVQKEMETAEVERIARDMVASLIDGNDFKEAAARARAVLIESTEPFTRSETIVTPTFTDKAFALSAATPADHVLVGPRAYVLFLRDEQNPDESSYEEASVAIREELISQKRDALFLSWMQQARKGADVQVNEELLDRV